MVNLHGCALCLSIFILVLVSRLTSKNLGKSLPGPKGLLYIGVPYELPSRCLWLKLDEWRQKYGSLFKFKVMGEDIVVITSRDVAINFMKQRNSTYLSRPSFPGVPSANHDMRYLPLLAHGDRHIRARRFAGHLLARIPHAQFVKITQRTTARYVEALVQDPSNAKDLTEVYASRITTELSWGDSSLDSAATNVKTAHDLLCQISPGASLLSKLPFLGHLWDILPDILQPWKVSELERSQRERAYLFASRDKAKSLGSGQFTLFDESLKLKSKGISDETEATYSIGMLSFIGSMLLATPVQTFLIAMCHFPEWQAKGAEEMDRVCPGRLPEPADLKNLPILRAIIRELHRWRPPVPLGAPHVSEQETILDGFVIPKEASVLLPPWILERDPETYPFADEFRPERWLKKDWPTYREPLSLYPQIKNHYGFGWGNRLCLGQDYVEVVNTIMIGSLLATCTVGKKTDDSGLPIDIPTMDYEPYTIFVRPYPWKMHAEARVRKSM